eukprot:scaffold10202_cov38-Cyclotella_meneghiniana.AAC.3
MAMGSLQTSIPHSDGKWVQGRSKPEISYEFLLVRGIQYQYQRKSLISLSGLRRLTAFQLWCLLRHQLAL